MCRRDAAEPDLLSDVTPAPPEAFNLKSRNGRYYGRGVLDMKFALASYLQIIDEIQDDLQSYDLGLMVTTDEENGGRDGTAKLVDEGYIPQVCVLPDGGDNWQIQTAAKGMWAFEVSATGRTAHGSRPWLGDNALDKLLAGLNEIRAIFPKHLHPDTNTITLSQMRGGDGALNQVPHSASMMIDIRTINAKEHARIYEEVERICRKRKLSQRHISDGAPSECSLTDPYIAPFVKLVEKEVGITVHGYHALGSSDIRFFVPFGVPCISVYPLGGNIHADDEWINIRAFGQFKAVTRQYLEKVAHTKKAITPVDGRSIIR